MSTVEHDSLGGMGQASEIGRLVFVLLNGSLESQAAYRSEVKRHPADVLLEQLIADLTIVHSLPKVGGTTIAATLNGHPAICSQALHLHYLSQKGLAFLERQIGECSHPNVRHLHTQLVQGLVARALLAANRALRTSGVSSMARKPYLICGMREPVALYLSIAFEGAALVDATNTLSSEYLHSWVTSNPLTRVWDDWFTDELGEVSGLDVYARPFPTDRGWDLYDTDAARVLIVRQENLDRLPDALGALYGVPPSTFATHTCNVSANKSYASHYATARRVLRLTETELDRVYAQRFVEHFYTAKEIEGLKRQWRANCTEHAPGLNSIPLERSEHHISAGWKHLQTIPGLHAVSAEPSPVKPLNGDLLLASRPSAIIGGKFRSLVRRIFNRGETPQTSGQSGEPKNDQE